MELSMREEVRNSFIWHSRSRNAYDLFDAWLAWEKAEAYERGLKDAAQK